MTNSGVCCANLKDDKALMKMGLALVLVGHVNFLLGALVPGILLRHIHARAQKLAILYAISNVIAIVSGLMGIIIGILAIVLSKNKKNRILKWVLLVFSFLAGFLAAASAVTLTVSVARAIINQGKIMFSLCSKLEDSLHSNITFECPFDPTRIYTTTLILWVLLSFMSIVEMVFSFRCFAVCTSFLYLCPCRKKPVQAKRAAFQGRAATPTILPVRVEETGDEDEPAEQDELLDGSTVVEQSDWL